jgi:hypothetical protein
VSPIIQRRTFEDLVKALDEITAENLPDHVLLIRDGLRDLYLRLRHLEVGVAASNHKVPRRNPTKEQKT